MNFRLGMFCYLLMALMPLCALSQEFELLDRTLFQGAMAEGVVYFQAEEEPEFVSPQNMNDFTLVDVMTVSLENNKKGSHAIYFSLVPKRVGNLMIPALKFRVGEKLVTLSAKQVRVTKPYLSKDMSLKVLPAKKRVYVGEPLRLDVIWESSFHLSSLRDMNWNPPFFHQENIKIVIPRSKSKEEDAQVGLPIGGQRVIADRNLSSSSAKSSVDQMPLGAVTFPLYIQFEKEGVFTLEESKLLCAHLFEVKHRVGNYAAYFNNGLFVKPERDDFYEKNICDITFF